MKKKKCCQNLHIYSVLILESQRVLILPPQILLLLFRPLVKQMHTSHVLLHQCPEHKAVLPQCLSKHMVFIVKQSGRVGHFFFFSEFCHSFYHKGGICYEHLTDGVGTWKSGYTLNLSPHFFKFSFVFLTYFLFFEAARPAKGNCSILTVTCYKKWHVRLILHTKIIQKWDSCRPIALCHLMSPA